MTALQGKKIMQGQIEMVDTAIDRLVHKLYGLTEEEVKAVEGETSL